MKILFTYVAIHINLLSKGGSFMTTKELEYLSDTLKGEQVIIKKYRDYSQFVQNQQLKAVCTDMAQKHQDHYSQLIQQLNS